jgi:hypothetical protein
VRQCVLSGGLPRQQSGVYRQRTLIAGSAHEYPEAAIWPLQRY